MNKLVTLYKDSPREGHLIFLLLAGFLVIYFLPVDSQR
ncbi:MAG: hypothetical protein ACJAQ6_001481, partial [Arenicella sp.]